MRMNFGEVLNIQDLGNHSVAMLVELGILLAGSIDVTPDSGRKHFYEIDGCRTVYYIYVSPVSGTIYLVAAWENVAAAEAGLHMADTLSSQAVLPTRPFQTII
jgi:hypothetical protein